MVGFGQVWSGLVRFGWGVALRRGAAVEAARGDSRSGAGMTEKGVGMTRKGAGMAGDGAGMTEMKAGMRGELDAALVLFASRYPRQARV